VKHPIFAALLTLAHTFGRLAILDGQVLGIAGFGKEESISIFKQVDTDGGGSVELDEFEAWWIESQRQHVSVFNGVCMCV